MPLVQLFEDLLVEGTENGQLYVLVKKLVPRTSTEKELQLFSSPTIHLTFSNCHNFIVNEFSRQHSCEVNLCIVDLPSLEEKFIITLSLGSVFRKYLTVLLQVIYLLNEFCFYSLMLGNGVHEALPSCPLYTFMLQCSEYR